MPNIKLAVQNLALAEPIPGVCAGCGTPTTETRPRHYVVGFRKTVKFDLPYCAGCHAAHRAYDMNALWIALGIIAAALGFIGAVFTYMLAQSLPLMIASAALIPVGLVLILVFLLKRKKPSVHTGTVLEADEKRIVLTDVNDRFGAALEALRKRKAGGAASGPKR